MVIERNTFLLVEHIDRENLLTGFAANGLALGFDFGFGIGRERGVKGRLKAQSVEGGALHIFDGEVYLRHSSRRGFDWVIQPEIPELLALPLPFLLTSWLDVVIAARCTVTLVIKDSEAIIAFDSPAPVISEDQQYLGYIDNYSEARPGFVQCSLVLFGLNELEQVSGLRLHLQQVEELFGTVQTVICNDQANGELPKTG